MNNKEMVSEENLKNNPEGEEISNKEKIESNVVDEDKKNNESDFDIFSGFYRRSLSLISPMMMFSLAILFSGQILFYKQIFGEYILNVSLFFVFIFLIITLVLIIKDFDSLKFKKNLSYFLGIFFIVVYCSSFSVAAYLGLYNSTNLMMAYANIDEKKEEVKEQTIALDTNELPPQKVKPTNK
ncbi:hypothetical protein [Providencia rettgeri]|uniref:hypothetical protein n=1 Tax=Providencia rettgeri TaxID=587 RepID=UPI002480D284|nr:hypothetical protein [Providencia rettgeri]